MTLIVNQTLHILCRMAAHKKNRQMKRQQSMEMPGLSNTKIMCLPPNNFIGNNYAGTSSEMNDFIPQQLNKQQIVSKAAAKFSFPPNMFMPPNDAEDEDEYLDEEYLEEYKNTNIQQNKEDEVEGDEGNEGEENNEYNREADVNERPAEERNNEKIKEIPLNEHNAAVCCSGCKEERRFFERRILNKINTILEIVRTQNNPMVLERRHNYSLLPPMPFDNINNLQTFDCQLIENEQMRDQFMKKIAEIGGKNVQKSVKFVMEMIMTDELCQKVVWTLGPENVPKINKFKFPYLIIDVIRNSFEGTKIKALEDRIADWLRRGGDRIKSARVADGKRKQQQ